MAKKRFTYDILHKKSATHNQKKYFSLETRRLAESFEGLNILLAQLAEELWRW